MNREAAVASASAHILQRAEARERWGQGSLDFRGLGGRCLYYCCSPHLPSGSRGYWSLAEKIVSFLLVTDGPAKPSADRRLRLLSAEH